MLCTDCWKNVARVGHKTCYRCHIHSIGFTFYGGGSSGRGSFHDTTIAERIREAESNPNAGRL